MVLYLFILNYVVLIATMDQDNYEPNYVYTFPL